MQHLGDGGWVKVKYERRINLCLITVWISERSSRTWRRGRPMWNMSLDVCLTSQVWTNTKTVRIYWLTFSCEQILLLSPNNCILYSIPPSSLSHLLMSLIEKEWTAEDKDREKQLMAELVTIIEQRNQIVNNIDMDRQR